MPERNPLEETRPAAQDWSDRSVNYFRPNIDGGISNVSNVNDRSLFQEQTSLDNPNIINTGYRQIDNSSSFIPEYKNEMLNWNLGNWDIGIGKGKFNLGLNVPLGQSAALDTGLGSTNEYQMAELTPEQQEWMRSRAATPDFISPDYSYKAIQEMENKPWDLQWGVQEPTTREEFDEYYNYLLANPSLTSWQT